MRELPRHVQVERLPSEQLGSICRICQAIQKVRPGMRSHCDGFNQWVKQNPIQAIPLIDPTIRDQMLKSEPPRPCCQRCHTALPALPGQHSSGQCPTCLQEQADLAA